MIDKMQIMMLKHIGYAAHEIVCLTCDDFIDDDELRDDVDKLVGRLKNIEKKLKDKMLNDYAIDVSEYAELMAETVQTDTINPDNVQNCAEAILKFIIDLQHGAVKKDEYYKKITEEGLE